MSSGASFRSGRAIRAAGARRGQPQPLLPTTVAILRHPLDNAAALARRAASTTFSIGASGNP